MCMSMCIYSGDVTKYVAAEKGSLQNAGVSDGGVPRGGGCNK